MSQSSCLEIAEGCGNEDSPLVYRAYIEREPGVPITQADVSSISLKVYDLEDTATATLTVASIDKTTTVFDTLQTWDREGSYNFKYTVAGTAFPLGGKVYQIEIKFTLSSGSILYAVATNETNEIISG